MIYLMRHGLDDESYIGGWSEIDLILKGKKQVKNTVQVLLNLNIDKIFCSDIKRAVTTSQIVNKYLQKDIIYTKELRELNKGLLNGMKKELAYRQYESFLLDDDVDKTFPNGESLKDLYNRIEKYLYSFILKNDNTLFITHRGVINMIYFILYGKKLNYDKKQFNVTHASLHELDPKNLIIKKIY